MGILKRNFVNFRFNRIIVFSFVFIVFSFIAFAQTTQVPISVEGQILKKTENSKGEEVIEPVAQGDVWLYFFPTYKEALQKAKILEANTNQPINDSSWDFFEKIKIEEEGRFIYLDANTGGGILACLTTPGSVPVVVRLNSKSEEEPIIIELVNEGVELPPVNITGTIIATSSKEGDTEQEGRILKVKNACITVPEHLGKTNARMVICPYVYNHTKKDTLHFRNPIVYCGSEFYMSQRRHVGFDNSRDSLARFIVKDSIFDSKKHDYYISDEVILPNVEEKFQVLARYYYEDYLGIYSEDTISLSALNPRKPMKFIQYDNSMFVMDPMKFQEKPSIERRDGKENISLSFKIGTAELNMADENNRKELERLENKIKEITSNEDARLRTIKISSVSSPDGSYSLNYNLSLKRLVYAHNLICNKIPSRISYSDQTDFKKGARVAKWTELAEVLYNDTVTADLLLKDSLVRVAGVIIDISTINPNHDVQSMKISRLPEYNTLIKRYLPKLRSMDFEYTAIVKRALTPDEILDRYNNDKDYRTGNRQFLPYEFWHLFQMVEDSIELENLYKLAYKINYNKKNSNILYLAANNLAISYMNKDSVDLNILSPLINMNMGVNINGKIDEKSIIINPWEIVANQMILLLEKKESNLALKLARKLRRLQDDDIRLKKLIAVAYCMSGYYKEEKINKLSESEKKDIKDYIEIVKNISAINNIVISLAYRDEVEDKVAYGNLQDMSDDDPLVCYLKSIACSRLGMFSEAVAYLQLCFMNDPKYIEIAKNDGDISEDLFITASAIF